MKRVTDLNYWMDDYLKMRIDDCVYNLVDDWDFVFIISGDGMVRMGKSVLAQQIGYYVSHHMKTPFSIDNIVFSGEELIHVAKKLPMNSVIIYDEARGELDSKKSLAKVSKVLQDFFAECGMYNHFFILVMPDFFELNKSIAVSRSHSVINVYKKNRKVTKSDGSFRVKYDRGFFEYFGRTKKKKLYILGKKQYHDYSVVKPDFFGDFRKFDIIDKQLYDQKKLDYIKRDRLEAKPKGKSSVYEVHFKNLLGKIKEHPKTRYLTLKDVALMLDISDRQLYRLIKGNVTTKNDDINDVNSEIRMIS